MTITVVQTLTAVAIAGNQTRTVPFTGVTAGNSLLIAYIADGAIPNGTVFTSTSYSTTNAAATIVQGSRKCLGALYRHGVASGSHSVVVDTADATFSIFGFYVGLEVSGLKNQSALSVTSGTNSGFGNTATLVSGTLPTSNQLLLECFLVGAATSPMNHTTPSGYTSQFARQTSGEQIGSVNTRIVSANTAQSLSHGTMAGSENWAAALFSFEEDVAAANAPRLMLLGVG